MNEKKSIEKAERNARSTMENTDSNKGNSAPLAWSRKISPIDALYLLVQWKKRILVSVFLVMVLTAAITLTMDSWYESKAVILLPERGSSPLESLSGVLGGLGQNIFGSGTSSSPQRYVAILKSRRLKEAVIEKYDLIRTFDKQPTRKDTLALLELLDETIIPENNTKNGTITITVRFKDDPSKTAEMTNFVVSKLDEINRELSAEQARSSRLFIEKRYNQAREDLKRSEELLKDFQKEYGIVALTEQTKASIEATAELQARIATTETEYNVLKKTVGQNHPDLLRLQTMLDELRRALKEMEFGNADTGVLIPFKNTPDLALAYLRLFRDVQINQKIVEYLVPQFEQAKIQEAKDTPTLLVLDEGKPAAYQYKPRKTITTLAAGFVSLILFSAIMILVELITINRWLQNEKIQAILNSLRLNNIFR